MPFDHELKIERAAKHLKDATAEIRLWLSGDRYNVRYEFDLNAHWTEAIPPGPIPGGGSYYLAGSVFIPGQGPGTPPLGVDFGQGVVVAYARAENPPVETLSVIIGDALHNMRSGLDTLAYTLSRAYTNPLPQDIASSSEFPIFGDEDARGTSGVGNARFHQTKKDGSPAPGSGLHKIRGWDPAAQTLVERLQPYHEGANFRTHPLWMLHDLDRTNKHRLLHTTVAAFEGTLWDINEFANIRAIGPGVVQSLGGSLDTENVIGRIYGLHPVDPRTEMHVKIIPALDVAFSRQAPAAPGASVVGTLSSIQTYLTDTVIPTLAPFL